MQQGQLRPCTATFSKIPFWLATSYTNATHKSPLTITFSEIHTGQGVEVRHGLAARNGAHEQATVHQAQSLQQSPTRVRLGDCPGSPAEPPTPGPMSPLLLSFVGTDDSSDEEIPDCGTSAPASVGLGHSFDLSFYSSLVSL